MLKNLLILFRYFCFWLLFFLLERLVFIVYNTGNLKDTSISERSKAFLYGLWMDTSMAGYICALPLLVVMIAWVAEINIPALALKIYTWTLIVISSFLTVVNFNIYREWGTKVNYRALEFAFGSPAEAFASSESSPVFFSFLVFFALSGAGVFLASRLICYSFNKQQKWYLKLPVALLLLGVNFLAIRGGWQLSPMNESMAYYSSKPLLNYAAVNTEWSLIHDVLNNKYNLKNPFKYYKPDEAKGIVKDLYAHPSGDAPVILTNPRPNVVVIIMESFTGNVVESLGGEKGINPAMEGLIKDGLFFNNIYASGGRTDKGVVAVLSAFPAQGGRSIMKENSKQIRIPALSQSFRAHGYATSFFYGGESRFFNMRSYLLSHNYDKIIDKADFAQKDMSSKWGAYDGPVYNKTVAELNKERKPFFATILTLTNHEPFELPVASRFKGEDTENKFRSTAYYADSCLGAFIEQAKKQEWYKNTLFIMVADHGHYLPRTDLEVYDPQRYRIPLIFYGDVIKPEYRGTVINKPGSQNDIAAVLLNQLNIPSSGYPWSKDLLNPSVPGFAFFNWDHGFGFVSPAQIISFDTMGNSIIYRKDNKNGPQDEQLLKYGKACMQEVYQQYVDF